MYIFADVNLNRFNVCMKHSYPCFQETGKFERGLRMGFYEKKKKKAPDLWAEEGESVQQL